MGREPGGPAVYSYSSEQIAMQQRDEVTRATVDLSECVEHPGMGAQLRAGPGR